MIYYKIWDTIEKTYVKDTDGNDILKNTEAEAEDYKELLLANGNYPDRPHTVFEIIKLPLVKNYDNTTEHTPLPWHVRKDKDEFTTGYMVEDEGEYPIANTMYFSTDKDTNEMHLKWDKPNAEFIVKACNNHYQLLEALKGLLMEQPPLSSINVKKDFSKLVAIEAAKNAIKQATE